MLKIWLAIGLAVSAAVVSMIAGIMHGTRLPVVLYRVFVSAVCLGGTGFLVGVLYERKILPYLAAKVLTGNKETNGKDVAAQSDSKTDHKTGDIGNIDETQDDNSEVQEEPSDFAPFTTDNFKRVSPPNS